ncbi:outer membrane beta-barrel protein [Rhodanobacter sp. C03]|uniref:outer membrane beta-barrel protein n=1 Tax=Rhodanobacter sp. C03 TaxID=1945858 RepID=UPI000986784E|nr:outer membrane beta-barrel protein [Rhodanobacter sp. C03]OOG53678.1 hypothetical protein B0E48_15480 [Rhodanobacter sp. C03]
MPASSTLSCAVALALAAASGAATAAQFDYSLFAGIEHSDNINLSTSNPISQNVLIPGLNFTFVQQGSAVQTNVSGTLQYKDYLGNAFDNQTLVQLTGQANWTVLPQRLDFTIQDFAGVEPLSTLSSDAPNNQQQTNVVMLGPTLHFMLGDTLRGQAELRYINSDASKVKEFDSSRGEAALRLFKDLGPNDQLSFNLETQHADFYNAPSDSDNNPDGVLNNPDFTRNELFGRYVSKLTHFNLDVALGWSQIDFKAAPTVSTPMARVTLGWVATPHSSFSVTAARQYSDAALDMALQPGQTFIGNGVAPGSTASSISTGGAVIDPQVYLDQRLEGVYTLTTDRLTLTASPLYRKLDYLNDHSFDQTGHGGSGALDYRLRESITLSAYVNEETLNYRFLGRRDESINYGISATYTRTPHWSWRLSIDHRQLNSTASGAGYRANEIYFGVVFRR